MSAKCDHKMSEYGLYLGTICTRTTFWDFVVPFCSESYFAPTVSDSFEFPCFILILELFRVPTTPFSLAASNSRDRLQEVAFQTRTVPVAPVFKSPSHPCDWKWNKSQSPLFWSFLSIRKNTVSSSLNVNPTNLLWIPLRPADASEYRGPWTI